MVSAPQTGPPLLSRATLTTLVASIVVALCSGTNYVFSAYSPQLGSRLRINHTQLNVIGLAGNIGVLSSGPIWGRIVDSRGPRISLASAFLFLLVGYSGIRFLYDNGLSTQDTAIPGSTFVLLVLFGYVTGSGGNAGLAAGMNSTAKTFPDSARATTVGLVLAGFGLSAFLFSTISHVYFPGDTSTLLLILALGTAFPMIVGFFLVRPIPLPPSSTASSVVPKEDDGGGDSERRVGYSGIDVEEEEEEEEEARQTGDMDETEAYHAPDNETHNRFVSRRRALIAGDTALTNVFGRRLARSSDFWLLFSILSILTGTGIMYINNVGSMSQALYAKEHPVYDDIQAAKWQATQVSTISVMSCAGRALMGFISDYGKNKKAIPRSYSLVPVSLLFAVSQIITSRIDSVKNLWIASAIVGLAYGSSFSLIATMCIEWFGIIHFSENWGYLSLAPILAGNLFSVVFGRNLDAHELPPPESNDTTQAATGGVSLASATPPRCVYGRECYVDTLYLTMGACFLAVALSAWACLRDREKMRKAARVLRV